LFIATNQPIENYAGIDRRTEDKYVSLKKAGLNGEQFQFGFSRI
jgi:hypothetical protein